MAVKSALYARFETDNEREESGVWVNLGGGDPEANPPIKDIKFLLRRLKSKKSMDVRAELDKPHANEIRRGNLSSTVALDLLVSQLAKGVIVDWDGVTDRDGNEIPYTPDNAYRLLKDLPELRDEIFAASMERDVFKKGLDDEAKENLSNT